MTVPASELESHTATSDIAGGADGPQLEKVAGRSPTQLAMARFRKDRLSMVSLVIVGIYLVLALSAPFLVHFGVLNPYSFHNSEKLDDTRRCPERHPGRDLLEPPARPGARHRP